MPFVAPPPNYFTTPTPTVQVGFGRRGYDFRLDPNQKGGKRRRVVSAAIVARRLARKARRLRLLSQLHQEGQG